MNKFRNTSNKGFFGMLSAPSFVKEKLATEANDSQIEWSDKDSTKSYGIMRSRPFLTDIELARIQVKLENERATAMNDIEDGNNPLRSRVLSEKINVLDNLDMYISRLRSFR